MGKGSTFFSFLRCVAIIAVVIFLGLLYYSNLLLEESVKSAQEEVQEIKNDLASIKRDSKAQNKRVLNELTKTQRYQQKLLQAIASNFQELEHIDDELENFQMMEEDFLPPVEPLKPPPPLTPEEETQESAEELLGISLQIHDLPVEKPSQADGKYPNLLLADPYYRNTLPQMLGDHFAPEGVRRTSIVGKPHNLHPFSNWAIVSNLYGACVSSLAQSQFGKYEVLSPDLAIKIEQREDENGRPEYWVHLRDGVYWQPLEKDLFPESMQLADLFLKRHQVTAHDFKFYFDAIMNPHVQESGAAAQREYLGDIESFTVVDDLTLRIRWKTEEVKQSDGSTKKQIKYTALKSTAGLQPLPRFVYQYYADGTKILEDDSDPDAYRNDSVWAQTFSEHWAKNYIVSCGPWLFGGMSDTLIRLKRNPDHFDSYRALSQAMEFNIKNSPDTIWQDFKAGKIDTHTLAPDQLTELDTFLGSDEYKAQAEKEGWKIHKVEYITRAYNYIGWNSANPLFDSNRIRQALTMAIDRKRIIEQSLNDMGIEITGPFFYHSPSYDSSIEPWPYDPVASRKILEEEGWFDSNGDGTLDKFVDDARVPFTFQLMYFVKNPTSKSVCDYIATSLKQIGVDCELQGVDISDLSAAFDDKSFEALYLGWALGSPPEEPKQLWSSKGAKEKGSSNAVGFANARADEIIDQLQYTYKINERNQLYHEFHQLIHKEAPYTFLYTPKTTLVYRDYLQNVFIPKEHPEIVPHAEVGQPVSGVFWIKPHDSL